MDEHEKYLFDLRGYLVVRDALTKGQLSQLSSTLESKRKSGVGILGSDRTSNNSDTELAWSSPSTLEWGGEYLNLIDLPSLQPYLEILLGKHYRLDHDYVKIDSKNNNHSLYLHGGGQGAGGPTDLVGPTDGGQCYYRFSNGRFFNGLVAVAFELNDVRPGTGGFACVPGSHKVNLELPKDWKISKTQDEIPECVDRVAVNAGDAIIFTEACAHGTVPWEGKGERRTIFFKYSPHAVAWSPAYYNSDNYPGITENQRKLLMPPSAFGPASETQSIWAAAQREQAELLELRGKESN